MKENNRVQGLTSLVAAINTNLRAGKFVNIKGASDPLKQLIFMHYLLGAKENKFATLAGHASPLILVLPNIKDLQYWARLLESGLHAESEQKVLMFPHFSMWGNDRYVNHTSISSARVSCLAALESANTADRIILCTLQGLAQLTIAKDAFLKASIRIAIEEELNQDDLIQQLTDAGYQQIPKLQEQGSFVVRGAVLDIFPIGSAHPFRLELFGDHVSSIQKFSIASQRNLSAEKEVIFFPACETLIQFSKTQEYAQTLYDYLLSISAMKAEREGMTSSLGDGIRFNGFDLFTPLFGQREALVEHYLDENNYFFFPQGLAACQESFRTFCSQIESDFGQDSNTDRPSFDPKLHFLDENQLIDSIKNKARIIDFVVLSENETSETIQCAGETLAPSVNHPSAHPSERWLTVIRQILDSLGTILIACSDDAALGMLQDFFATRDISLVSKTSLIEVVKSWNAQPIENAVIAIRGDFASWFWDSESQTLCLPAEEILGPRKKNRPKASKQLQEYLQSFRDLERGDLLVHETHGIGRYLGIRQMTIGSDQGDFIDLEYQNGDKLYLPVDRVSVLQKYQRGGSDVNESGATLDRLGSQAWSKRKTKVRGAVKDIANKLLAIHAKRASKTGFVYPPADANFQDFIDDFPFVETVDQARAWEEIDADLIGPKPLERVIVGDVGFGKTEIAMRAAMRAVLAGRQVMVLVPTTVLCYQHEKTFKNRLERFGVEVRGLSRFTSAKERKTCLSRLNTGQCDVLIGTHRLLSKDCKSKNLGLLIIDEEHRFGVSHKEALKEIQANADVLVLTATPIPRTLHMAMIGMRDISLITTPPNERLAVKTMVAVFDDDLIRNAINKEMQRGGQVFYVHNRVSGIENIVHSLQKLLPHARISYAHGQMKQGVLEQHIVDFIEQRYDILICTTIIESGIDMPNVNTLIVADADRFGLAQLYQIRGRVGRSKNQAYAYFLTRAASQLKSEGLKRLEILQTYQDLGAGFHIANHDLEIRGAGNLLGGEQSGHVNSVGLDLYTSMLNQEIEKLGGQVINDEIDPEIKISVKASIPADYIDDERERLNYYKQIFSAKEEMKLIDLEGLLKDLYGSLPDELKNLLFVAKIKVVLRQLRVSMIQELKPACYSLKFSLLSEPKIQILLDLVESKPRIYGLASNFNLRVNLPGTKGFEHSLMGVLKNLSTKMNQGDLLDN